MTSFKFSPRAAMRTRSYSLVITPSPFSSNYSKIERK